MVRAVEEIYDKVVELERFPDDVVAQPHDPEKSNQTELGYRLAWARTYLKKYGLLENSSRGIWALTAKAKGVEKLNPQDVVRAVRGLEKKEEKGLQRKLIWIHPYKTAGPDAEVA